MRYWRPAAALLRPDTLLTDAVCAVEGDRIAAWLRPEEVPAEAEVVECPDELWTAAPWMLHAHLESYDAPSHAWPRAHFAEWAQALLAWRLGDGERMTAAASAQASAEELWAGGCAGVVSSVSEPDAIPAEAHALQVLAWPELFEPDTAQASSVWDQAEAALQGRAAPVGVALHAPFSVSTALAQRAFAWAAAAHGRFVSVHLGEHDDERQLLAATAGPLATLLQARGRDLPSRCWASPVDWLDEVAPGATPTTLLAHAGDLTVDELRRVQAKGCGIAFCPGTHRYFDRPAPQFEAAGLPAPFLGCDSRASNERLDPWHEVTLAREILPSYSGSNWWASLTTCATSFLGLEASFGSLEAGRRAAVLRFPDPGLREAPALCESLTSAIGPRPLAPPGLP